MIRIILSLILGLAIFNTSAKNISEKMENVKSHISLDIILYVQANRDSIGNGTAPDPNRPRSFPTAYLSTICSENGIFINGINTEDISLYEIYDRNENCLGIFQDEEMFLEILFSLSGTYEIRFVLEEFSLTGMITI